MPVIDRAFFNIVVVRAPLTALAEAFDNYPPMRVRTVETPLAFPAQPYGRDKAEMPMLLWSPGAAPQLTAFMPSVSSGDYFFTSYSTQFRFDVFEFRSTSSQAKDQLNEFAVYAGGARMRCVQALQDFPRWVFFQDGNPLPFESEERYRSRLVKSRLTRDLVLAYAEAWGAPVRNPAFWSTGAASLTFVPKDG